MEMELPRVYIALIVEIWKWIKEVKIFFIISLSMSKVFLPW